MSNLSAVWTEALPEIRNAVTGTGVWNALNSCKAITLDGDVLVIGMPFLKSDAVGYLKLPAVTTAIEAAISKQLGRRIALRVIEGSTLDDWRTVQRRDVEANKLKEQSFAKAKVESESRLGWESVYEAVNRAYASLPNKSYPQTRARYLQEAARLLQEAMQTHAMDDDAAERNFARCIERVAQNADVPAAIVALRVLELNTRG